MQMSRLGVTMAEAYNTNWCDNMAHSRPATDAEKAEDTRRRVAALESAESDGLMGARQVADHWRALDGFQGYRRCTRPADVEIGGQS